MDDKMLELTGALIGVVRATDGNIRSIQRVKEILTEGLFVLSGCVEEDLEKMIEKLHDAKAKLVPGCMVCGAPCGRTDDYDMKKLAEESEEIRGIKLKVEEALKTSVRRLYNEQGNAECDPDKLMIWCRALFAIGESWDVSEFEKCITNVLQS